MVTHNVTILLATIAALGIVVANVSLGRGEPPAAADMSADDLMALLHRSEVDPVTAASVANAKKRAYEAQQRAQRAGRDRSQPVAGEARKKVKAPQAPTVAGPPAPGNPSAAHNRALGQEMNAAKGWAGCWTSLDNIWHRESGWNERASNPYSGAYGIPQALPGSKMSTAGADWQTNPATQIAWGLGYIGARYGNPCKAWSFWQANHWY